MWKKTILAAALLAGGVVGGKDRGGCQQEQGGEGAAHLGNVAEGRTRRA